MTKEDRQLLLKDLCARLPYGVKIQSNESKITATLLRGGQYEDGEIYFIVTKIGLALKIGEFKPYLRPMSSMTEEEKLDYVALGDILRYGKPQYAYLISEQLDYLNTNHFDYHGLIEKGLALEAPEGMYKN